MAADPFAWLAEPKGRDQFSLLWMPSAGGPRGMAAPEPRQEVFWGGDGKPGAAESAYAGDPDVSKAAGQAWLHTQAHTWSPKGTYLTTLHGQGVRSWSGGAFKYGVGFPHARVSQVRGLLAGGAMYWRRRAGPPAWQP